MFKFINTRYTQEGWATLYYNASNHKYQIWVDSSRGSQVLYFESNFRSKAVGMREAIPAKKN